MADHPPNEKIYVMHVVAGDCAPTTAERVGSQTKKEKPKKHTYSIA